MPVTPDRCDALIVGGGPAGSSCAWRLAQAGLDVLVIDRARFPRDKTCAGWITPHVIEELSLDVDDYRRGRTFQPIVGFRTGVIGEAGEIETRYRHPISYGIRRCEFDHYLLERSGARLELGTAVDSIQFADRRWLVNERIETPIVIGAGGHFCPIGRLLNSSAGARPEIAVVAAQEAEFAVEWEQIEAFATDPECPELYFSKDLQGYGWCFRKERHVNLGFGSLHRKSLPGATAAFLSFLASKGRIPNGLNVQWHGHAYALQNARRRKAGTGVLLVGDAAGLAYPQSGEGIRPAVESGLLAAATVLEAGGDYSLKRMRAYERRLVERFGAGGDSLLLRHVLPQRVIGAVGRRLLTLPAFVRHVVIDRWFLHADEAGI